MSTYELKDPILPGQGRSDYERYLRTDELLALQKEEDERLHPDELTFQVVHQSSELLMKSAAWELERARRWLEQADYLNAARVIRRANAELDYPINMLRILEGFTPYEYHIIRAGLGHGSGLDSPGFLALLHIAPRLGEAFTAALAREKLTVRELYRRHAEFIGLHDTAEGMLDFDERMQTFRFVHLKLAQRIIGPGVVGTMGTPVEILKQRQEHFLYKHLWEVRNEITAWFNERMAGRTPAPDQG
jgi:tryptophan 2,3-dioxygenase